MGRTVGTWGYLVTSAWTSAVACSKSLILLRGEALLVVFVLRGWGLFVVLFHALSFHPFQVSLRRMRTFESVPEMDWPVRARASVWSVAVGWCVLLGPHTISAFAPIFVASGVLHRVKLVSYFRVMSPASLCRPRCSRSIVAIPEKTMSSNWLPDDCPRHFNGHGRLHSWPLLCTRTGTPSRRTYSRHFNGDVYSHLCSYNFLHAAAPFVSPS